MMEMLPLFSASLPDVRRTGGFGPRCFALAVIVALLCFGTLMQMLGVSVTFWNLEGSSNPLESSVLEGFALISRTPVVSPTFECCLLKTASSAYDSCQATMYLRPPIMWV